MIEILTAVVPSAGVAILFFIAMRGILRADQREREAIDAEQNAAQNDGKNVLLPPQ